MKDIDDKEWNLKLNVRLKNDGYVKFSIEMLEIGKLACKVVLKKELGLRVGSDVLLIGFISHLDY